MEPDLPWKTLSIQSRRKTCAVAVCKTPHPPETSLHTFPKDPDLCKKWISACKRKDSFNVQSAIICSRHFSDTCFERDMRSELLEKKRGRILKAGSIPTLNLLPVSSIQPPTISCRAQRFHKRIQKEVVKDLVQPAATAAAGGGAENDDDEGAADLPEGGGPPADVAEGGPAHYEEGGGSADGAEGGGSADICKKGTVVVETKSTCTQVSPILQDKQVQCDASEENRRLKMKIKVLQTQLAREKKKRKPAAKVSLARHKKIANNFLKKTTLTRQQIKMYLSGTKKTHWQPEDIVLGITLRSLSRKSYEFLRRKKILPLPSLTTLRRYVKCFECKPGIQNNILHGKVRLFSCRISAPSSTYSAVQLLSQRLF